MVNSTSFCILNCVEDAQAFLAEFSAEAQDWLLLSTHGAVNDYLRSLKIDCLELSSLINCEFIVETFKEVDTVVNNLLCNLDQQAMPALSAILSMREMAYFFPLYAYLGKFEYLGILKLKKALELLFAQIWPRRVMIYQSVKTSFFAGDDLLTDVLRFLSGQYGFSLIVKQNDLKSQPASTDNLFQKIAKAIDNPTKAKQKIKGLLLQKIPARLSARKKTILLQEPLYDLEFLKVKLPAIFNVVLWPDSGFPSNLPVDTRVDNRSSHQVNSIVSTVDIRKLTSEKSDSSFALTLLAKNLIKDFQLRGKEYIAPLLSLDRFHQQNHFDLAIWGNSPIEGARALLNEYLLKAGVPVLGMQHGGSYGIQDCLSCHFDSDFSRCTHYMTYGFDEDDLKQTYPHRQVACTIIPVGSYKTHQRDSKRQGKRAKIDILFPLTNSLPVTTDGFRIKPDLLTFYQLELLKTLDTFAELWVVIKPMPGYSDKNCSVVETLKRLNHAQVLENMNLERCLAKYDVRAVVIEYPSTPLLEVMGKDIEIFLLADPALPFSQEALNLLQKRVHYFERVEDLQQALVAWKNGELPILRDQEFYFKHVFRENTAALILDTIETCV